eukprot:3766984-Rhodomonas_salina.1
MALLKNCNSLSGLRPKHFLFRATSRGILAKPLRLRLQSAEAGYWVRRFAGAEVNGVLPGQCGTLSCIIFNNKQWTSTTKYKAVLDIINDNTKNSKIIFAICVKTVNEAGTRALHRVPGTTLGKPQKLTSSKTKNRNVVVGVLSVYPNRRLRRWDPHAHHSRST